MGPKGEDQVVNWWLLKIDEKPQEHLKTVNHLDPPNGSQVWCKEHGVSPAYCKYEILEFQGPTIWIKPPSWASLNICERISTPRINKYRESGSPCFSPRLHLKGVLGRPMTSTEEKPKLSKVRIHPSNFLQSPMLWETAEGRTNQSCQKLYYCPALERTLITWI